MYRGVKFFFIIISLVCVVFSIIINTITTSITLFVIAMINASGIGYRSEYSNVIPILITFTFILVAVIYIPMGISTLFMHVIRSTNRF